MENNDLQRQGITNQEIQTAKQMLPSNGVVTPNASAATPVVQDHQKDAKIREMRKRNQSITEKMGRHPVNKRFQMMESIVSMVIRRFSPSVIVCGTGGLGKSHMVKEALKRLNLVKDEDGKKGKQGFTWVAGHIAPTGVYTAMHNRRDGGVLILDDVDIWSGETMMELCKAALDSYGERVISWNSSWADNNGLPRSFDFKGQVIFITNKMEHEMPQPLVDRSWLVPVVLTTPEIFERMKTILPKMHPKVDLKIKQGVLEHLKKICTPEDPVTFRSLERAIRLRMANPPGEYRPNDPRADQYGFMPRPDGSLPWYDLLDVFGA